MDEKVIIKSEQYNFKSYWITVLVIAGLSLLLAIPNIDWDWFLRRPFDWIIEEGWTNIFFDIMLITLIVGTICYFWLRKMQLVVSDKRVYGQAAFGRQVDLPLDSITAIGKGIIKGIAITTASGAIKFKCIKNRDEIYDVVSKLLMERQTSKPVSNEASGGMSMTRAEAFQELKEKLQAKGSGNLFDFHWRRLEEYVRRYDTAGESEKKLLEADFDVSYKKILEMLNEA